MSVRKTLFDTVLISSVGMVRLAVQFLALPILSRILSHEDYGVVAMAMPFVFFAMLFADAGIGMSLVRTDAKEKHIWSTCFWLSTGLGLALTLLLAALSPFTAALLEQPRLTSILTALSCVLLLQGLSAVPGAYLQQAHRFRIVAACEMSACLGGLGLAVLSALMGFGLWALVFQQLAQYGIRCVLTMYYSGYRPERHFRLAEAREHLTFGRDVLGMNLALFFSRWLDNLIVGKVLGAAVTGVFSMAFQFVKLPQMVVAGPLQYVLYARMSKFKDDTDMVRGMFLLFTRGVALLVFPAVGMVAASYAASFSVLLSDKWEYSGYIYMLVAPASAVQAVTALVATVLLVLGRADLRLRAALEQAVIWAAALLITVSYGLEVVGITYTVVSLLYAVRTVHMALPLIGCTLGRYADALWRPALLTALLAAVYTLQVAPAELGDLAKSMLAALLALVGVVLGVLWDRRAMLNMAAQLK